MDGGIDRCHHRRDIIVIDERQEWISKRAYGLWEAAGRPQGKDREHWEQAARERAELERVALPEHLKTKRNSNDVDEATRRAIDAIRRPPPKDDEAFALRH